MDTNGPLVGYSGCQSLRTPAAPSSSYGQLHVRRNNEDTANNARIIGREKGKDHANSKYVSQQAAFSNQQDTADNSTHRDRDRENEGLDSNRREMHVYNTSQDNVEYSHYSTIPADHVFVDPNHTHPSILKQNSTNLQQDTTYLEPEHYILLTPDNVYLEPDQTYFQPISGNSMTSTT